MVLSFLFLSFGLVVGLVALNYRRFTRLNFELQHNVLMTKHPLIFVPGKRSLVYFLHYWNQIPEFLAAHGYEVYTLSLPWRNNERRRRALRNSLRILENKGQKFHLFVDGDTSLEVEAVIADGELRCLASVTSICDGTKTKTAHSLIEDVTIAADESSGWRSALWRIHNLLTDKSPEQKNAVGWAPSLITMQSFLSRAQHLAERDLLKNS